MSHVVRFFFSASGVVFALVVAACWIWRRPQSATARRFLFGAAAGYALISTYAAPATVSRALTAGYHKFTAAEAPHGATALVVLGAGTYTVGGWENSATLMSDVEAARVLEAWRVFRLIRPAVVITSGGPPTPDDRSKPSGLNMHDELVRLGVPDAQIIVDIASHDTHDSAVLISPMLRTNGIEHLVLVTSDTHMRRSLGTFRAQGWNAVPATAPDPNLNREWYNRLLPSPYGLDLSQQVTHELLGLPYYWLRGWWRP
jgi:uncharacterized SAM-binding protein YcdF (DUF218 family)